MTSKGRRSPSGKETAQAPLSPLARSRSAPEGSITFHESSLPLPCVMASLLSRSWGGGGRAIALQVLLCTSSPAHSLGPMTQQSRRAASACSKQARPVCRAVCRGPSGLPHAGDRTGACGVGRVWGVLLGRDARSGGGGQRLLETLFTTALFIPPSLSEV